MKLKAISVAASGLAGLSAVAVLLAAPLDDDLTPGGIRVLPPRPFMGPTPPLADTPSFEEQVVELVNQERWTNGMLPPLKHVSLLDNSSETHSQNMATRNFFAHCDPDTQLSPFDRIQAAGYFFSAAAENIAAGSPTPQSVMAGWMGSPGHRTNILRTEVFEIGVGYVLDAADTDNVRDETTGDCTPDTITGPFFHYWTQNFGARNNVYPVVINREAYETSSMTVNLYVYGEGFATHMRFRNENDAFSPFEPYNPDKVWNLSPGSGVKTVTAEIRDAGGTIHTASDTIVFNGPGPAADFFTVTPCRAVDTRNAVGALGGPALFAGDDRTFTLSGVCGIPATAVAISANVAVTESTAPGNLRIHPGGSSVPLVSAINYAAGSTRSNNAVLPLNDSGQLAVFASQSSGTVHFILDVNGYFE